MVLVRFSVVSLAPPGVVLAVSGSCASLGKWSCDAAVPLTGRLGATRRSTEPDFHSVELEIPEAESEQVEYKFLELGDIKWEEGPDGKNRILKVEEKDVIHRDDGKILLLPVERWEPHWSEKKITSYFYKGVTEGTEGTEGPAISVTQVLHQLFVGSCPRRRSHIEDLKKRGITTVFNFQTEDDCKTNCIPDIGMDKNPLAVGKIYEAEGMEYIWMPTWDMDTAGRANMLPQASFLLAQLLRKGHKVYCHCNAGVGRSTAAVCGYLTFALGLSVREMQHVMASSRPVTVFNLGAIEEARPHYKARYEVDAEMQPKADLRCREEALALLKPF